jgi:hypothetical protein
MRLALIAGQAASRESAAAILGVQDDSLSGGGSASGTPQPQWLFGGTVVDDQVVVRVRGGADEVAHREICSATGVHLARGGLQLLQAGGDDDGDRTTVVLPKLSGGQHRTRHRGQGVVAALVRAAGVAVGDLKLWFAVHTGCFVIRVAFSGAGPGCEDRVQFGA